ncbi:PREDICTED: CCR4-NOT transcription complex subunit 1-like [Ipomoea nil]|uniref:CCR4-NOT transcription complex subunit 1-like n=1 Tax=Ipomoea nil TaxID=35883 RepID=UPI00090162AC|nr:PREDICTED: CCR4-NOT transcription complex subunit 1-like [Ipomoea nil]
MVQLVSTSSNHIRYLLQNLNHSNSDSVLQELLQCAAYGTEGSVLVLGICFDHLNIYGKDLKNLQLEPVFASIFKYLLDKPNFSTVFFKSVRGDAICVEFLENLCTALQLTVYEKIGIGHALSYVEDVDIKMCGKKFFIIQLGELLSTRMSVDSVKIVQNMLLKSVDLVMNMLSPFLSKDGASLLSDKIHEADFSCMNFDLLNEGSEDDFDALLAEMEKEMSMADIMKELGYGSTASVLQCKEILSLFLPLTEITIARILGMTVYTYSGLEDNHNIFLSFQTALGSSSLSDLPPLSSWNTDALIDAINQLAPGLNWGIIIGNLDHEGFYVPNEASFSVLMSMYRRACQDPFPLHAICGSVWKNAEGQLSFLRYAVLAPPELFTFAHSGRQLAYVDAVKDHKLQPGRANHAWLCLDLLEVFCQLAESGHASLIRCILEYPLKHCPEVLLLGLAHINTAYNLLQHEISSIVFPTMLKSTLGTRVILYLWNVNPSILLRGVMDAMEDDPNNINKVLDSCQELKILSPVLNMIPYSFGIRLAALASHKEFIDLGKWLSTNLKTYKDNFYEECLKFIKEVLFSVQDDSTNHFPPPNALLNSYLETVSMFIKVLQSCTGSVSSFHLSEELEKLNLTCMNSNSSLENISADSNDIEASANSYFKLLFTQQLTIESMIQILGRFKESSEKREKSIFGVMIANLFEEYKFFPKYPENQLKTAAIIFGSLIKHHLVTHINLKITLKAVLDALQEPADTIMFGFGTLALEQFEDCLIELPEFCHHISQISHLRVAKPELIQFIEHELARVSMVNSELDEGKNYIPTQFPGSIQSSQSSIEGSTLPLTACGISYPEMQVTSHIQLPQREQSTLDTRKLLTLHCQANQALSSIDQAVIVPSSDATCIPELHSTLSSSAAKTSSLGIGHPAWANSTRGFGAALNIKTLVAAAERRQTPIEAPASEVQDKISFIMNNLSDENIEVKAKEIVELLKEEHYPWFAQYIVMRRASIEPNYHALYVKLLDKVNLKALFKEVVRATYENCKVLLQSGLIKSSSEERSLLKNLGSWLGKITIGRDHVLLAREIDPKSLIIEAYEKGLMIAVIPFTSKILESCQNSLAYQPPNAWTMAILGLLVEIHALPNLKMNLRFDIEVLFKNLGVDLKDINPTSLLKDRVREFEGNPDFSNKDAGSSQPQFFGDIKLGIVSNLNEGELSVDVASTSHPGHHSHIVPQYAASLHLPSRTLTDEGKLTALVSDQHILPSAQGLLQVETPLSVVSQLPIAASNIEEQVIINPKLHDFGLHSHFQSVLPIAMEKTIKDIVMSITMQRSVFTATQTTKELVLKDYSMESDETQIRNVSHFMVASLAGSLIHVHFKEPLFVSISSQLRNTLEGIDIANEFLEHAVQLVTNDNLELGCALIEQTAIKKAIQTIDEAINIELASMTHREGHKHIDSYICTEQCKGVLPEALRIKSGHLSYSQQRVYEDFVRLPWKNQSIQSSNALSLGPASSNNRILSEAYVAGSAQMSTAAIYSSGLFKAGTAAVLNYLDIASEEIDTSSSQLHSASLPPIGMGDGASSYNFENDSIVTPFSSVLLRPIKPCNVVKGTGCSIQPQNPTLSSEDLQSSVSEPSLTTGDALDKYRIILEKLENLVSCGVKETEIQGAIAEVPAIILRCKSQDEAALAVARKVFKGLYENASNIGHVSVHLAMLCSICDISKVVVKELTSWVIYSDEEQKFNKDITVHLIQSELLSLAEYNIHMAELINAERNKSATVFSISLIQTLLKIDSKAVLELQDLVDALGKLAARPGSHESLKQLVEIAKNPSANVMASSGASCWKEDNFKQSKEKKAAMLPPSGGDKSSFECVEPGPAGFHEQVSMLFVEWYQICGSPGAKDAASALYVSRLHRSGLLKGDDVSDCFFQKLMEISVLHCLSSEVISLSLSQASEAKTLSFLAIDLYAKLVYSVVKFYPVDQGTSKISLLSRVLAVTVKFIQRDSDEKSDSFDPRPYFRLFINWIIDLCSSDPIFDGANFQILSVFASAFHALQPLKVPGFSFVWLELVTHRCFMPKLLTGNAQNEWPYFHRLLVDLLQFMEPFLRNAGLGEAPVCLLYEGTLRVLLILLHDFPEFLCDYHFSFCDVIPPICVQMRNMVLSACPRNIKLPNLSVPDVKIDLLPEIKLSPRILSEVDAALKARQLKNDVDEYLKTRQQGSLFLRELKQTLLLSPSEATRAGTHYNVPLINSLVLYVGILAVQQLQTRTAASNNNSQVLLVLGNSGPNHSTLVSAAFDIFQTLSMELDKEGRYVMLNAIANQLRYPNNHTHYFSLTILYLFANSNQEMIQEQIIRVILERLVAKPPHPWGLVATFLELTMNKNYNFWERSFTRCSPDIENLLRSALSSVLRITTVAS